MMEQKDVYGTPKKVIVKIKRVAEMHARLVKKYGVQEVGFYYDDFFNEEYEK